MNDLWKYYVPFKDLPDDGSKSIVVVGGRGTGKSMFFLCNSWQEKYASLKNESASPLQDFLSLKQVGIYYKVDSTFVGAMNDIEQGYQEWTGLFNTYLSICLLRSLIPFVQLLYDNGIIDDSCIHKIISVYFTTVRSAITSDSTLMDVGEDCTIVLQEIEDIINNPSKSKPSFRITSPGTIFKAIIDTLHSISSLSELVFKVYIDEYESFSNWQQQIVNTLIKQSNHILIYNIGMRHNGMKTQCTIAENEILQPTHDYYFFNFDDLLTGPEYAKAIKGICQKRLDIFFKQSGIVPPNRAITDIEFYLSKYDSAKELARFEKRKFKFKTKLEQLIRERASNLDNTELMVQELCTHAAPLNARLHLALLLRSKHFRPSISDLYSAYMDWMANRDTTNSKKYRDWLHNAKNGIMFLLAKESGLTKWYYGFDTFTMLSSGVVRYFLELCEQTFNFAIMDGFDWNSPKEISPEIQTRAVKYVSQCKVNEITSYPIHGKRLRIFVQCFGEICRDLHHNENTTLGEPEINHFTAESLQLSPEIETYLNSAITWLVLQKLPQTKSKENIRTSVVDYHLNKIYTPYFEISCNKKRKITLDQYLLDELFSADISRANMAARSFLDKYWGKKEKLPLSPAVRTASQQLSIFGDVNGESI